MSKTIKKEDEQIKIYLRETAEPRIKEILEDKKEWDDWTQISISIQDAMQAAANIWGRDSDKKLKELDDFLREIAFFSIRNLSQLNIHITKKEEPRL